MIPYANVKMGEIKVSSIIDTRGVGWSPFGLPENMPLMNPCSWELHGEWEDGWHLSGGLLMRVDNNQIMEAFSTTPLSKENNDMLGNPFKLTK